MTDGRTNLCPPSTGSQLYESQVGIKLAEVAAFTVDNVRCQPLEEVFEVMKLLVDYQLYYSSSNHAKSEPSDLIYT